MGIIINMIKMTNKPIIKFIGPIGNYSDKVIYSTIEECYQYCNNKQELGIDIETSYRYPLGTFKNEHIYQPGLDPYLTNIVMLQIGDLENIFVIDTRTIDITPILPLWENKDRLWVGANLRFEAKHLLHNYGIIHHKIWDIMLVEMNLTNGMKMSYSLAAMAYRYLGIKPAEDIDLFTQLEDEEEYINKSIRLGFLTIGNKLFSEAQILYGSDDILYPLEIKKRQALGYKGYNPKEVHLLENSFCLVLADIELKGMAIDTKLWLENYEKNKLLYQRRLEKLNEYVENNHIEFCEPPSLFNTKPKCKIEWTSSKQVIKLFRKLNICPQEKSKQTGRIEYTVGATALVKTLPNEYKEKYNNDEETDIIENKDLILNYLLLSATAQSCTTFGEEWLKYVHPITGRVHSSYRQILHTGRISSNRPNLQNIPGEEEFRKCFIATKGYKLINADYSSQESRVLAEVSGDEKMLSFFNEGHPIHKDDFHCFVGSAMFSILRNEPNLIITKKTHPKERTIAKTISFKTAYGGSAHTMKDDFGVEEEVAQEFIDSYMNAFPSLKDFFEKGKKHAVENGYIDIAPDRRYWEKNFDRMKELNESIWKFYPNNYKELPKEKKEKVKKEIYEKHPELKEMWKEYFVMKGDLERASQNYKIQGFAGAQTKMAAIQVRKKQIANGWRDKIYLTNLVHDEVIAEAIEGMEEQGRALIEDCMVRGAMFFCKKVKMKADAVKVEYWHH